jgi:SAM-dependent methyltransferase
METYGDVELQLLAAMAELRTRGEHADQPALSRVGAEYFRGHLLDWREALGSLLRRGVLLEDDGSYRLSAEGLELAEEAHRARPPMYYWYTDFYAATAASPTSATFCERVYGRNLCQHGFMDMIQLARLLDVLALRPAERVLDLGCGNGLIAEYISDSTGATIHGLDYIPEAIHQAKERTAAKRRRLTFDVGDIGQLSYPDASFDAVVAVDTLYFGDLQHDITEIARLLRPGGRLGAYYSHTLRFAPGYGPDSLQPDETPLARALRKAGLEFRAWDVTAEDLAHAERRLRALADLEAAFAAEGNQFLFENRLGEARGVKQAVEEGTHVRCLYLARAKGT